MQWELGALQISEGKLTNTLSVLSRGGTSGSSLILISECVLSGEIVSAESEVDPYDENTASLKRRPVSYIVKSFLTFL